MAASLKDYTTLKIGGNAKEIITVTDQQQLTDTLTGLSRENQNFLVIGSGSNLLVSDDGYDGTVIINRIQGIMQQDRVLKVKSGTLLQDLVDYANEHGLAGLQALAGIPGTVGGAVYGNAGAYGQTISDHLNRVTAVTPQDSPTTLNTSECAFGYRDSIFKKNHAVILEAEFELHQGDSQALKQESVETIKKREAKYPPGIKCPGSFFKNIIAGSLSPEILNNIPPDKIMYGKIPAGALLEMVNAKGDRLGDIEIAPYHANLFINNGNGTAEDFYELAKKYVQKVYEEFGIKLEPEVQFINLPSFNYS